jgi:sulfite exporter TauE/SafE
LVYAALAGSISTADPVASFLGMAAFGLGTIPALLAVGFGGSWFLARIGLKPRRVAPYLALANAVFLMGVALNLALRA